MTNRTRTVELTGEQIACIRDSLNYKDKALRDTSYERQDRAWVARHRSEQDALITSIREALA